MSTLAKLIDDGTSTSLDYIYVNRPDSRFEPRSQIHHGSASLAVAGRPPERLRGRYWTTRDSRGELQFEVRRRALADDHKGAAKLFAVSDPVALPDQSPPKQLPATGEED